MTYRNYSAKPSGDQWEKIKLQNLSTRRRNDSKGFAPPDFGPNPQGYRCTAPGLGCEKVLAPSDAGKVPEICGYGPERDPSKKCQHLK